MIEPGDTILLRGGSIHWIVVAIEDPYEAMGVLLRSGMTGRHCRAPLSDITLYRRTSAES